MIAGSGSGKSILTHVVYGFLHKKPNDASVFLNNWERSGKVQNWQGYFGYLQAARQPGFNYKGYNKFPIFFHTDDIFKPKAIAILTPRGLPQQFTASMISDPSLIPEYFEMDHTQESSQFLFFDLSDFQGSGTGDETWAQKSGVVIGDKRVGPDGHYINHGWERYQDTKLFGFMASINNAKL